MRWFVDLRAGWTIAVAFILVTVQISRAVGEDSAGMVKPFPWTTFRLSTNEAGFERWVPVIQTEKAPPNSGDTAQSFLAVVTEIWPEGLVPIFDIEEKGAVEFRRRPKTGQEGSTEPWFFALPLAHEADARLLSGYWECTATNGLRSKSYFGWQLAMDEKGVMGRFDPTTDFRFAHITGGSFRSNRIELNVEYIADKYHVWGEWRSGRLTGRWRHLEHQEEGTWEGQRPTRRQRVMPHGRTTRLYEWWRIASEVVERRYRLEESPSPGLGWRRRESPLVQVWQP